MRQCHAYHAFSIPTNGLRIFSEGPRRSHERLFVLELLVELVEREREREREREQRLVVVVRCAAQG